jgi:hypothetical protein
MKPGCCVIVEPRKHKALSLSLKFAHSTIPQWPIYVCHGTANEEYARSAAPENDLFHFVKLPYENMTISLYNNLMTDPRFYRLFRDYEYILIFQTDSLIFPFSPFAIEDFMGWDYVGAPWIHIPQSCGGNGGLSLRKTETMIRLLTKHRYPKHRGPPEDCFICDLPGMQLPPRTVSQRFSAETISYPCPFGVHKPWLVIRGDDWERLVQYAPAVATLRELNQ